MSSFDESDKEANDPIRLSLYCNNQPHLPPYPLLNKSFAQGSGNSRSGTHRPCSLLLWNSQLRQPSRSVEGKRSLVRSLESAAEISVIDCELLGLSL